MAVKIKVRKGYITYSVMEVTLTDSEYQAFRDRMDSQGFYGHEENAVKVGNELLEHPTAKECDLYNEDVPVNSIYDTAQDMDYFD